MTKTNALRLLDQANIKYEAFEYDANGPIDAKSVASYLNEPLEIVFKTLVTKGSSNINYVFVVPACSELDLKKAAKYVNEKNIEMIPQKELLPLTGYIHGGCSPIGQKKLFETIVDETALLFDYIYVSGGKVGLQIKINPNDLKTIINAKFADISKN